MTSKEQPPGNPELNEGQKIIEREQRVARLFEEGLDAPDIIALHGSSLEAIQELIQTGRMPTGKTDGCIGYIYVFRLDQPVPEVFLAGETQEENIMGGARMYAGGLSFEASLVKSLQLDYMRDSSFLEAMDDIRFRYGLKISTNSSVDLTEEFLFNSPQYDEVLRQYIQKYGFEKIKTAFHEAFARKGIIIGLNQKVLELNPQSAYEEFNDEGWRINLPNGLSLDYISGLEPVGQIEYDYLENIQRKYE